MWARQLRGTAASPVLSGASEETMEGSTGRPIKNSFSRMERQLREVSVALTFTFLVYLFVWFLFWFWFWKQGFSV